MCLEVSQIVFGPILDSRNPALLAKVADFMLNQGLTAKTASEIFKEETELKEDELAQKIITAVKTKQKLLW